ncbi:hypothetical protein [Deinococcus cellulosilyticus]|nr:hypothetical protein [Deinococcus cellulosilyticus]
MEPFLSKDRYDGWNMGLVAGFRQGEVCNMGLTWKETINHTREVSP